ncbi:MAG: penicillin-insensitive murein endopeptidase [Bradymonadia bacterium]
MSDKRAQLRRRIVMLTVAFTASIFVSGAVYFVSNDLQHRLSDEEAAAFDRILTTSLTVRSPLRKKRLEPTPQYDGPPPLTDLPYPHSVALGRPDRGALQHPAKLKASAHFAVREGHNYGTQELIDALKRAGKAVHDTHGPSPKLHIGDISLRDGGPFPPHWSHQSGCDVDLGYYLRKGHDHTTMGLATPRKLDVARTWTFLESLLLEGNIEYIFSDRSLIPLLYREAKARDLYTQQELNRWFRSGEGLIRHLNGHRDHLHIRIKPSASVEAIAQYVEKNGRYAIKRLLDRRPVFVNVGLHDNWTTLANRYGVGLKRLKRFNGAPEDFILPEVGTRVIIGFQSPKHGYRSANPKLTGRSKHDI